MSKKVRKTIEIESIKTEINRLLALPEKNMSEEEKKGLCSYLETLLLRTGNYHGFNYVDWCNGGFKAWQEAGQPDFPNKEKYIGREYSRIYY